MAHVDEYEAMDRAALRGALLALRTCPNCRADLRPVAFTADVYGCETCRETWHLPTAAAEQLGLNAYRKP